MSETEEGSQWDIFGEQSSMGVGGRSPLTTTHRPDPAHSGFCMSMS